MTRAEEVLEALRNEFTCTCGEVHELPPVTVRPQMPTVRNCRCGTNWGFLVPRASDFRVGGLVVHDEISGWSSWPSMLSGRSRHKRRGRE